MKCPTNNLVFFLFVLHLFAFPASVQAEQDITASHLFKHQKRQADKGNVQAQFKVGSMYENGAGIQEDQAEAKRWYELAAKKGLSAAQQRSIYLEVKQTGFKAQHADWLARVKADSKEGDADAKYLLAQLYRQGIGVKKNLAKATALYNQITVLEVPFIYQDLELIDAEIDAIQDKKKKQVEQVVLDKAAKAQQSKSQIKAQAAARAAELQAEEQKIKAEKKRKYEQVMLELKRERALIDGQQSEITGDSADDEI